MKTLRGLCKCCRLQHSGTSRAREGGGPDSSNHLNPRFLYYCKKLLKSVDFDRIIQKIKRWTFLCTQGSCGVLATGMSNQDVVERYITIVCFNFLLTWRCGHGCRHCSRLLSTAWIQREVVERLTQGYRHQQPTACPDSLYQLMLECWRKVPEQRPTFQRLCQTLDDFAVVTETGHKHPATLA